MTDEIDVSKLMELYIDTLQKCGTYLLDEKDEVIEYNIFEEFDIGIVSFFHYDNLLKLKDSGLINNEVMEKSMELRDLVIEIQQSDKWNVEGVRKDPGWRKILNLVDKIKRSLE